MENINIDNIDIYEVDKKDYESYFYRLPKNEIIKTTPRSNLTVYKDLKENVEICGIETTLIMGQNCCRFFIFNLMDEERLGPHKVIQYINLSQEEYLTLLRKFFKNGGNNEENLSHSCSCSER